MYKFFKVLLAAMPFLFIACEEEKKLEVVCWGDSLTAPSRASLLRSVRAVVLGLTDYPRVLQEDLGSGYDVINCGVGGENTLTIMARQGAAPMLLTHDVRIFNESEKKYPKFIGDDNVPAFISSWDSITSVSPLVQLGYKEGSPAYMNPCRINGRYYEISSESKIWQENGYVSEYNYYIDDLNPQDTTFVIETGSRIETAAMRELRGKYANVFFIGQNGGFKNVADLIAQIQAMIKYSKSPRYVVVSFHKPNKVIPSPNRMTEMEDSLSMTFGKHYVNLRRYLMTYGLKDAGITPTSVDNDSIAHGAVPPSLLKDRVHFTPKGYEIIGHLIGKKFKSLGY